ncbi:MAG: Fic family protein [Pseudomonadota bacterium]
MIGPGRSAREQALYAQIHDPETGVLKNTLGITTQTNLEIAERYLIAKRAQQGLPDRATQLDIGGLLAIHQHLFQDVYPWAGQIREYTTGRGPAPFAPPEQIAPWLDCQFATLEQDQFLKDLAAEPFAKRAAEFVNEINAAHPFVEGNGRVQRTWLRGLAAGAGHRIELRSADKDQWYEASRIGFERADRRPMAALIEEAIARGRTQDQTPGREKASERRFTRRMGPSKERAR